MAGSLMCGVLRRKLSRLHPRYTRLDDLGKVTIAFRCERCSAYVLRDCVLIARERFPTTVDGKNFAPPKQISFGLDSGQSPLSPPLALTLGFGFFSG